MKIGKFISEEILRHFSSAHRASSGSLAKRVFLWAITIILSLLVGGLFVFAVIVAIFSISLPDVRDFAKLAGSESTIIYDRDGGILHTIHGEENRKYVPLSEISPFLQKATIAIEDDQFYEHRGFDLPGIARGALYEFFSIGRRRGGSTITQQLAKNAFLSPERALTRKIKELILAIRLESAYDKNKILELYLNRIPYGNNTYGTELASKIYFNKPARDLTLGESVILASLPKAPTFYSPYGPNAYSKLEREFNSEKDLAHIPKTLAEFDPADYSIGLIGKKIAFSPDNELYIPGRADIALNRMEELGFIGKEEKFAALSAITRLEFRKYPQLTRAQHFVFEIKFELEKLFGKDLVAQGGLKVYTTLDPKLQDAAEKIVRDQIAISKDQHGVSTGALFSIDAKTGGVLAMVGAADYFDLEARGNVNHVFAKRQPGSSFKPIVYAKAFLNRYSPATALYDTPTNFGGGYEPQNYEGGFRGPMTARSALGQSRNIPAIKTYFLAGQQDEIIRLANKMGIDTLKLGGDYGPSLAIGAGEVTLAEMVQAFSVFANGGVKRDIHSILKIVDRDGAVLFERKPEDDQKTEEVLDPQVAYLINSILSDKSVYLGQRLDVPGHTTAAKTGTSNKEITPVKILPSNLWTIGYTPSIVTGVWAGNSLGQEMKPNADGYNVAAPMWAKFMVTALEGKQDEQFPKPDGIKSVVVSRASGKLPSGETPKNARVSEIFASFSVPTEIDDIYKEVEVNKLDNKLPNKYTPMEYVEKKVFMNHRDPITEYPRWLQGIRDWVKKTRETNSDFPDFPPTEKTAMFDEKTAAQVPTVQIISPSPFSVFTYRGEVPVEVNVDAPNGIDRVLFFFDDRKVPSAVRREEPFSGKVTLPKNAAPGPHFIVVKLYDKIGYVVQAKIEIKLD